jgi:hypothetical protein
MISNDKRDPIEANILNRIIRVPQHGWELEADPYKQNFSLRSWGFGRPRV